jgi:hypothetical protein
VAAERRQRPYLAHDVGDEAGKGSWPGVVGPCEGDGGDARSAAAMLVALRYWGSARRAVVDGTWSRVERPERPSLKSLEHRGR